MSEPKPSIAIRIWAKDIDQSGYAPSLQWFFSPMGIEEVFNPTKLAHSSYNAARLSARRWANRNGYGRIDYFRGAP